MRTRRRFTSEFKAKVALEAIEGQRTIAELATKHELHPNLITQWKRQAIEKLAKVFADKRFEVQATRYAEVTKLHAKIGHLVVERNPRSSRGQAFWKERPARQDSGSSLLHPAASSRGGITDQPPCQ